MKVFIGLVLLAVLLSLASVAHAQPGNNGNGNGNNGNGNGNNGNNGKGKGNNPFFSDDDDDDEDEPLLRIKVEDNDNFQVSVASFSRYKNGAQHAQYYTSTFEIAANRDFRIILSCTDFTNALGQLLDPRNFGYFIKDRGGHKAGSNHLLLGNDHSPSAYALLGTEREIIVSSGFGNAGDEGKNKFEITFELGTQKVRELNGLPRLMDQAIAPGVYRGTVTLRIEAAN